MTRTLWDRAASFRRCQRVIAWWLSVLCPAMGWAQAPGPRAKPVVVLERFDTRHAASFSALPRHLTEVSGLAVAPDGRVFAHNDERGIVSEIDPCTGRVVKSFSLGAPALHADLEGLAIVGDQFFLITSTGALLQFKEGANNASVPFTTTDTGLGRACELEGLAYEPADRSLLVGCKQPRQATRHPSLTLMRWSLERRAPASPDRITVPLASLGTTGSNGFRTSAVERDELTGHYLVIAGPERLLAEVTSAGEVLATIRLRHEWHRQPEGITLLGDSVLVIADEGGNGRGTVTCYRRAGKSRR
ncbi:MAG: SdiA-regulated domain-containing protein [Gemmatimonadaceae bacterium]